MTTSVEENIAPYLAQAEDAFQLLNKYNNATEWSTISGASSKEDVDPIRAEEMTVPGSGIQVLRAEGIIRGLPPRKMLKYFTEMPDEVWKKYDDFIETERDLVPKQVQDVNNTAVKHRTYLKMFTGVSQRDLVSIRCLRYDLPGGCAADWEQSTDHPLAPAGANGFVRMKLFISGKFWRPCPDDPTSCILTQIVHADPSGWIPAWIINRLKTRIASHVRDIRKMVIPELERRRAAGEPEPTDDVVSDLEDDDEGDDDENEAADGSGKSKKGRRKKRTAKTDS